MDLPFRVLVCPSVYPGNDVVVTILDVKRDLIQDGQPEIENKSWLYLQPINSVIIHGILRLADTKD